MLTEPPPAVASAAGKAQQAAAPPIQGDLRPSSGLGGPISVGRWAMPLWVLLAGSLAAGAGLVLLLDLAIGTRSDDAPETLALAAEAAASVAPSAIASTTSTPGDPSPTPPSLSLVQRAARGQADALEKLQSRPAADRSSEEVLAISRGREAERLGELDALAEQLKRDPARIADAEIRKRLRGFINDPRTAVTALGVVAATPDGAATDLLFDVWTGTRERTDTTRLAQELLFSKDVRAHASPALSVVLDLRGNQDCDRVLNILARALEHADRRSLVALTRLHSQVGCGPNQTEDCYPCLREGKELQEATDAAARRAPPPIE